MGKLDIIVLLVDCLREDYLRAYVEKSRGNGIKEIFRCRREIRNSFSVGSTTTPAVASLLSGLYPFHHGVRTLRGYRLRDGVRTLPEILRENGYRTEAYMCGPFFDDFGLGRGFDVFDYREAGSYVYGDWGEKLIRILNERCSKPRFVLVHLWELHFPKQVVKRGRLGGERLNSYYWALSSLDRYFEVLRRECTLDGKLMVLTGDHGERISLLEDGWRILKRLLFRTFRIDTAEKRRKWERVKEAVLRHVKYREGTDRFKIGHGFGLYDYLLRIPVWFGANLSGLALVDKPISSQVDLMPTILEHIGIQVPEKVDGISLGSKEKHDYVYFEECMTIIPEPRKVMKGIRDERYKYVWYPFSDQGSELYDTVSDPGETRNIVAKDIGRAGAAARLVSLAGRLHHETEEEYMSSSREEGGNDDEIKSQLRSLGYFS